MRLRGAWVAAILAATLACGAAAAQDAGRGAALAEARCNACHGAAGISGIPDIPSLAAQQPGFITLQLILIREGIRHSPAMRAIVEGLADREIEDLAAHFGSLPPGAPPDRRPRDAALAAAGAALLGPRHCASCHLPSLAGRAQIPRIAGQREEFLRRALREYRDGMRIGADPQMNGAVVGLTDGDVAALAHDLAQRD